MKFTRLAAIFLCETLALATAIAYFVGRGELCWPNWHMLMFIAATSFAVVLAARISFFVVSCVTSRLFIAISLFFQFLFVLLFSGFMIVVTHNLLVRVAIFSGGDECFYDLSSVYLQRYSEIYLLFVIGGMGVALFDVIAQRARVGRGGA